MVLFPALASCADARDAAESRCPLGCEVSGGRTGMRLWSLQRVYVVEEARRIAPGPSSSFCPDRPRPPPSQGLVAKRLVHTSGCSAMMATGNLWSLRRSVVDAPHQGNGPSRCHQHGGWGSPVTRLLREHGAGSAPGRQRGWQSGPPGLRATSASRGWVPFLLRSQHCSSQGSSRPVVLQWGGEAGQTSPRQAKPWFPSQICISTKTQPTLTLVLESAMQAEPGLRRAQPPPNWDSWWDVCPSGPSHRLT